MIEKRTPSSKLSGRWVICWHVLRRFIYSQNIGTWCFFIPSVCSRAIVRPPQSTKGYPMVIVPKSIHLQNRARTGRVEYSCGYSHTLDAGILRNRTKRQTSYASEGIRWNTQAHKASDDDCPSREDIIHAQKNAGAIQPKLGTPYKDGPIRFNRDTEKCWWPQASYPYCCPYGQRQTSRRRT